MVSRRNISGRKLDKAITSDDILGKDVIDIEGNSIGIVEKVLIDPSKLEVVGLEVDKGFLRKGLTIGKSYIKKVTDKAIFLNIRVAYEIKGMQVFDKFGAKVGTVADVEMVGNRNKVRKIFVRRGLGLKKLEVPAEFIDTIGYSVMLSVEKNKLSSKRV